MSQHTDDKNERGLDDEFERMTRVAKQTIEQRRRFIAAKHDDLSPETSTEVYLAHAFLKYAAPSTEGPTGPAGTRLAQEVAKLRGVIREASGLLHRNWSTEGIEALDKAIAGFEAGEVGAPSSAIGPRDDFTAFYAWLDVEWPLWRQHAGEPKYHDMRRSFFAGLASAKGQS